MLDFSSHDVLLVGGGGAGLRAAIAWFAADKTGFHMLHTLFQTSLECGIAHQKIGWRRDPNK